MDNLVDKVPSKVLSLSAVAVGFLLISDLNFNEQNAIGNWLMLAAQVLCTNAYFDQIKNNSNNGGTMISDIELLKKIRNAIEEEIKELEKDGS